MSKKRIELKMKNITVRELKEALSKLSIIIVGTDAKNNQLIEGDEWGAHYKITKERSSKVTDFVIYVFRVSGPEDSRLTLTSKLIELLGNPSKEFPIKSSPDVEYFWWDAKKIDEEAVL